MAQDDQEIKKFIRKCYQDVLGREPDQNGFRYYFSLIKEGKINQEEFKNKIVNSDEAKSRITNIEYWNDLEEVRWYLNELASGLKNIRWELDIIRRFENNLPFQKILIFGENTKWLRNYFVDLGIGSKFDIIDHEHSKYENFSYNQKSQEIEVIQPLQKKYDAVFNYNFLSGIQNIENFMVKLSEIIKPESLIFIYDYIGPVNHKYSSSHIEILKKIKLDIPKNLWPNHEFSKSTEKNGNNNIKPEKIPEIFKKYFDIVCQKNLNGGIAFPILLNNIKKFKNKLNSKAYVWLEYLLKQDFELSNLRKVPILFWYSVGTPKSKNYVSKKSITYIS